MRHCRSMFGGSTRTSRPKPSPVRVRSSQPSNRVTRPTIGHEHRSVTRRASLPEHVRWLDSDIAAETKSGACSVIAAVKPSHSTDDRPRTSKHDAPCAGTCSAARLVGGRASLPNVFGGSIRTSRLKPVRHCRNVFGGSGHRGRNQIRCVFGHRSRQTEPFDRRSATNIEA